MRYALTAAVVLLAVPCLAATKPTDAPAHPASAFAGLAMLCRAGSASSVRDCTILKIEPPADGLSLDACEAAMSAAAKQATDAAAQHGQSMTVAGVRCLSLDDVRAMLHAPQHVDAPAAPQSDAAPPAAAAPPDDDTIHGSTDGWRHV